MSEAKTLESEFAKLVKPGGTDLELVEEVVADRWGRRPGYPTPEQCTKFLVGWAVNWKELSRLDVDDDDDALARAALNVIDKRRVLELLHERYAKWGERAARHVRRVWAGEEARGPITRKSRKVTHSSDPKAFAEAVQEAAARPTTRKFGTDRAFIASVFEAFGRKVSKQDFVRQLLEAHRGGRLSLARADLVGAMDPALVRESHVRDPKTGAEYHFVRLGGSGLTAGERAGAIVEAGDHLHWVKRID
jgi:hypothetical protein